MIRTVAVLIIFLRTALEIVDLTAEDPIPDPTLTFGNSTQPKCPSCKCYLVDCTILKQPDIDCEDRFTSTCESRSYIVEEEDCVQECDCCIAGSCMLWSDYYCFIFRAYQFLSVLYFLVLIIEFFALIGLFKHFFSINRQWDLYDNSVDWEGDPKVLTLRFDYSIFIRYRHDFDKKVSFHSGYSKARGLLDDFAKEANTAWRNWYLFSTVFLLFSAVTGFTLYTILRLPTSPTTVSLVFWVLNVCGMLLLMLTALGFALVKTYREVVGSAVVEFEKSFRCKVQILSEFKLIQFRFKKEKTVFAKHVEESVPTLNDIRVVLNPSEDSEEHDRFDSSQFIDVSRSLIEAEKP